MTLNTAHSLLERTMSLVDSFSTMKDAATEPLTYPVLYSVVRSSELMI
jgi:hypothetical protein